MRQQNKTSNSKFILLLLKIKKLFQEIKYRGIKISLKRILNEVWSNKQMLVYRHQHNIKTPPPPPEDLLFLELNEHYDHFWINSLVNSWPKELEQYRKKEYLESAIRQRLENGEICIIAYSSQHELFGAVWIGEINAVLLKTDPSLTIQGKMLKSLFIIHSMRGKKLGRMLISKAVDTARQRGICNIYSLIHLDRKGSIIAHEATGFIITGKITIKNILFKEKQTFG